MGLLGTGFSCKVRSLIFLYVSFFRMVRTYKPKVVDRTKPYTEDDVAKALVDLNGGQFSLRQASAKYNIPVMTLQKRFKGKVKSPGKAGHPTALSRGEEASLAENIAALGDYGLAFDLFDFRMFIQFHLNRMERTVRQFKNNLPGEDWARLFLKRHADLLTQRHCQNISRQRAALSPKDFRGYFTRLERTIEGVPPRNIINYDETNLTDDPKTKQQIFRKGIKHAERIMSTTKVCTSIMFAATATGDMLPPMVVYKGVRMQPAWQIGGPIDAEYDCSPSGWFDAELFIRWFKTVFLRFIRRLPKDEPKVLIGDNAPSHMSVDIVRMCEDNNVRLVFLPPNATHLLQPLDVGIFRPLKVVWRTIVTDWRKGDGRNSDSIPKWMFPRLLLQLVLALDEKWERLCVSSFRGCGVYPLNPEHVISKLTRDDPQQYPRESVSDNLLTYLKTTREESVKHHRAPRRKAVNVEPGTAVTLADFPVEAVLTLEPPAKRRLPSKSANSSDASDIDELDVSDEADEETPIDVTPSNLTITDYVLVHFVDEKKKSFHCIGQLKKKQGTKWETQFWRKTEMSINSKTKGDYVAFKLPNEPDILCIDEDQIIMKVKVADVYKNKISFRNVFNNLIVR